MSGSSSSPRFRIRLDDGSEVPVDSVEGLARRVARGDLLPDTPLYDASTGDWRKAGSASVVRFILDELVRDGAEIPEGWSRALDSEADPDQREPESESTPPDPPEPTAAPDSDDPLDIGLSLEDIPPIPPETDEGTTEVPEEPAGRPDPWGPEFSSRRRDDEWLTPSSAGGLFASDPREPENDPQRPNRPTERSDSPGRPGASAPRDDDARDAAGGRSREIPAPRKRREEEALPYFEEVGRRRSRWVWVAVLALALGSFVGGRLWLTASGDDIAGADPAGTGGPQTLAADPLVPPEGLQASAESAIDLVSKRFQAAADSMRAARGLVAVPPTEWLGGYYLANAPEFPQVREYWESYGAFIEELRLRDRAVFLEAFGAFEPEALEASDRARLETYLRARYANSLPARRDQYDQLTLVAASALALHDFVVEEVDELEYTPAVGPSVPRDPVLEVGAEDDEVQRELEFHLDELFRALDRSRGGGPPSPSGLRDDLFGGFGTF